METEMNKKPTIKMPRQDIALSENQLARHVQVDVDGKLKGLSLSNMNA